MSAKYTDIFLVVKYILRRILRTSTANVVLVCYMAKFVINHLYTILERSTITEQDNQELRKTQPVAKEGQQHIKIVQDEKEAGYALRKTKSSTVFPAHHSLTMTTSQRQANQQTKQKAKLDNTRRPRKTELEQLRHERIFEERHLERRRRDIEGESNQLKNWLQLSKSIPRMLENFPMDDNMPPDLPCAKACATQNFPIGEAELRQELRTREEGLRREISMASDGDLEVPADFESDVPIEDRLLLLMDVLESTYREAFEDEKTRLKLKKKAMDSFDSAVCLEYDAKENL